MTFDEKLDEVRTHLNDLGNLVVQTQDYLVEIRAIHQLLTELYDIYHED